MVVSMVSSKCTIFVEPASLARSDLSSPGSRLSQHTALGAKSVLLRAKNQFRFLQLVWAKSLGGRSDMLTVLDPRASSSGPEPRTLLCFFGVTLFSAVA